mgnify:FL=1|jgi:type IX secretion system PorP/SprF family membrane protein
MIRRLLGISLLFVSSISFGQDIHHTQWYDHALQLNPANTGNFEGAYRFAGNFRQQWKSVTYPFRTVALAFDANNFLRSKGFSLGAAFYNDVAGDSRYSTNDFKIMGSHNFRLSKDTTHSIQFGWNAAYQTRSIDFSQLTYGLQFNGNVFDPDLPGERFLGRDVNKLVNFGFGLGYDWYKEERRKFRIGLAVLNPTQPTEGYMSAAPNIIPRRITATFTSRFRLNYDLDVEPYGLYQRQNQYQELVLGTSFRYTLDHRFFHYRAVFVGISSRIGDAANGIVGYYHGSWKFGASYDVNYSPFTNASNYRGGFELSVVHIWRNVLPRRVRYRQCPNYL